MSRKLIIVADDYGMCESVNQAIEECLASAALRATSIITNMGSYSSAAFLRKRFPKASLGIHWNLTQGRPVLPARQIPTLVNARSEFLAFPLLRKRLLVGAVNHEDVRSELSAQCQRFIAVAGRPDFWNTHEGIHLWPGMFHVFTALSLEIGIPAMRCHRRITVPCRETSTRYNVRHPLYWLKGRVIAWWASKAQAQGLLMPDGVIDTPGFGKGKAAIEEIAKRIPWSSLRKAGELVIHPAVSIHKELFGNLTESRLREYEVFRDPDLKERLRLLGVQTVGFEVLRDGR